MDLVGQCFVGVLSKFCGQIPAEVLKKTARNCIPLMPFNIHTCFLPFLLPPSSDVGLSSEIWVLLERNRLLWLPLHWDSQSLTAFTLHSSMEEVPLSTSSIGKSPLLLPNSSDPCTVILGKEVALVIPPSTVCPNSSLSHCKCMLESPSGRLDSTNFLMCGYLPRCAILQVFFLTAAIGGRVSSQLLWVHSPYRSLVCLFF